MILETKPIETSEHDVLLEIIQVYSLRDLQLELTLLQFIAHDLRSLIVNVFWLSIRSIVIRKHLAPCDQALYKHQSKTLWVTNLRGLGDIFVSERVGRNQSPQHSSDFLELVERSA
jgi:hypothetical protein